MTAGHRGKYALVNCDKMILGEMVNLQKVN